MPQKTFHYKTPELTVTWNPEVCIHSGLCWKGLRTVFDPTRRPWIVAEAASTEAVIHQVRKCPSGALSYTLNEAAAPGLEPREEAARITEIEVLPNGPLVIRNECVIKHADGRIENRTGKVSLCRCGGSANKPYCDGSHKKNGFAG